MGITHNEVMAIIGLLVATELWLSIISHQLIKISKLLQDWRKDNGYDN
jgi:hypothetical protein